MKAIHHLFGSAEQIHFLGSNAGECITNLVLELNNCYPYSFAEIEFLPFDRVGMNLVSDSMGEK